MATPATLFSIEGRPPFRDMSGRFVKASDELLQDRRDLIRVQGRRFLELARAEAPRGKTGKFRRGLRWRSFVQGDSIGFKVTDPQPLGLWIREGTKPHAIPKPPRPPGKALYFYWPKGPNGAGWYSFFNVWHPGTKPNRYPGRAYRRWLPGARKDLARIGDNFSRTLRGKEKQVIG